MRGLAVGTLVLVLLLTETLFFGKVWAALLELPSEDVLRREWQIIDCDSEGPRFCVLCQVFVGCGVCFLLLASFIVGSSPENATNFPPPSCSDHQIEVDVPRCNAKHELIGTAEGRRRLTRVLKAWVRACVLWTVDCVCVCYCVGLYFCPLYGSVFALVFRAHSLNTLCSGGQQHYARVLARP